MFHKRLLKEFSDNRKYVAGMVIMQWAALLANVALMYVLAAYVGRISGIVKGESLTTSPSDGVLLIVFAAALFVRIAATSAAAPFTAPGLDAVPSPFRPVDSAWAP